MEDGSLLPIFLLRGLLSVHLSNLKGSQYMRRPCQPFIDACSVGSGRVHRAGGEVVAPASNRVFPRVASELCRYIETKFDCSSAIPAHIQPSGSNPGACIPFQG